MRPEFTLAMQEGPTIHILKNWPMYFPYSYVFSYSTELICKHFSFNMNMVAESDYILSTHGSQVELHESRRCTSATSRIPKLTNPNKPKGWHNKGSA
jgi:hypothetical protein